MQKHIVFFIGTTAEYIKVFTIIEELKMKNIPVKVIASGQNEIIQTDIAQKTNLKIDLQLSYEKDIVKNVFGLFSWFFKTMYKAPQIIKENLLDVDFPVLFLPTITLIFPISKFALLISPKFSISTTSIILSPIGYFI